MLNASLTYDRLASQSLHSTLGTAPAGGAASAAPEEAAPECAGPKALFPMAMVMADSGYTSALSKIVT